MGVYKKYNKSEKVVIESFKLKDKGIKRELCNSIK